MIEHVTVFVGNIPYEMSEAELKVLFLESRLNVISVMIEMDERDRSRGFGFVTLASAEDAEQAIEKLNRKEVGKLKLRINLARADSHYLKADKNKF
jgi:RNA recognition motif-containing protein